MVVLCFVLLGSMHRNNVKLVVGQLLRVALRACIAHSFIVYYAALLLYRQLRFREVGDVFAHRLNKLTLILTPKLLHTEVICRSATRVGAPRHSYAVTYRSK